MGQAEPHSWAQVGTSWPPEKDPVPPPGRRPGTGSTKAPWLCLSSTPPPINLPLSLALGLCVRRCGQLWHGPCAVQPDGCQAGLSRGLSPPAEEGRWWGARGRPSLPRLGGLWLPFCAPIRTDPAAAAAAACGSMGKRLGGPGERDAGCRAGTAPALHAGPACGGPGAEPHCGLGSRQQQPCSR